MYLAVAKSTLLGITIGAAIGVLVVILIVVSILVLVTVIGMWKTLKKANQPGVAAIIPYWSGWLFSELAGLPGWLGLGGYVLASYGARSGMGFGIVLDLLGLAAIVYINMNLAPKFGKTQAFGAILLTFFPFIGWPILGFGSAKYNKSKFNKTPKLVKSKTSKIASSKNKKTGFSYGRIIVVIIVLLVIGYIAYASNQTSSVGY